MILLTYINIIMTSQAPSSMTSRPAAAPEGAVGSKPWAVKRRHSWAGFGSRLKDRWDFCP